MNITKAKITKDNTLVASFKNENEDNVTIEERILSIRICVQRLTN